MYRIPLMIACLAGAALCARAQNFKYEPDEKIAGKAYFSDPGISPDGAAVVVVSHFSIKDFPSFDEVAKRPQ